MLAIVFFSGRFLPTSMQNHTFYQRQRPRGYKNRIYYLCHSCIWKLPMPFMFLPRAPIFLSLETSLSCTSCFNQNLNIIPEGLQWWPFYTNETLKSLCRDFFCIEIQLNCIFWLSTCVSVFPLSIGFLQDEKM